MGFQALRLWLQFCCLYIMLFEKEAFAQKNPYFKENRTTMVHLFEWTWPAIAKECEDFLGPEGYGGVQISPPNEVRLLPGKHQPWWARYQPVSYLLNSNSGTESQLRDMIARCNRAGVRIYVDAVLNHMTGFDFSPATQGTAGSMANYEKRSYPAVPYTAEDFNSPCSITNYHDPLQVRNCQLSSLLDLDQSKPHVREMLKKYLNALIDMGVAGFRIDAAKHMWPKDLEAIYGGLKDLRREFDFMPKSRPFIYQEVIDLGGERISKTEYNHLGLVTEFKFSAEIGRAFRGHNELKWLRNWGPAWNFLPTEDSIVFVDNHDNQRGHGAGGTEILTYKDGEVYKKALIFMLAHPYGKVARIMSSYVFTDTDQGPPITTTGEISKPSYLSNQQCDTLLSGWVCEHRWPEIVQMMKFRNIVGDSALQHWWDNGRNQVAFSRGSKGFLAINMEKEQELFATIKTGLPKGAYRDIFLGTIYNVDDEGKVQLKLPKGPHAVALHVEGKI